MVPTPKLCHVVLYMQVKTLFPSVRCGLEMAILETLAASADCSLWELLDGRALSNGHSKLSNSSLEQKDTAATTQVCGLLDSFDSPSEVADAAADLVGQGFSTLKLKVGRPNLYLLELGISTDCQ